MPRTEREVRIPVELVFRVSTLTRDEAQATGEEVSRHVETCASNGNPMPVLVVMDLDSLYGAEEHECWLEAEAEPGTVKLFDVGEGS